MIDSASSQTGKPGISAVSTYRPPWNLPNEWYESIPAKFVKHTGILNRPVAMVDEVELAVRVTENLIRDTGCERSHCAAVVFTSPSFVPVSMAREHLGEEQARQEQLNRAARRFVDVAQLRPRRVTATNTFCAGYARSLALVKTRILPSINLQVDEFILVITTSRISRITDYACRETGALFGDLATATLISRMDSKSYPVHFELLNASTARKPTNRPFFRFSLREQVLAPTPEGGRRRDPQRIVFSLDGMGIADVAPRAMAHAAHAMLTDTGWRAEDVHFIVPHQAGSAIVRLAEMKLGDAGFTCEVINGMTSETGNISSGSIPYALNKNWWKLAGNILCPVASVGPPGRKSVSQGCIALRSTALHHREPVGPPVARSTGRQDQVEQ